MDENEVLLRERVTRLEQDLKSETHQREKLGEIVEDMRDIANEVKHIRLDMRTMNESVNSLKEQPAKRWDTVIIGIISAVVGGLGAAFISVLMGGG